VVRLCWFVLCVPMNAGLARQGAALRFFKTEKTKPMATSESGLRRLANRNGYRLMKSRSRNPLGNYGAFMLLDCK
jgi:hypothetical protein